VWRALTVSCADGKYEITLFPKDRDPKNVKVTVADTVPVTVSAEP